MITPKFSVIVPTHNGADRLPSSLESVKKQTFTNYELIVICDSCDDDSASVAESFGAQVIITDVHRDGLARNAGLDVAQGEWVLFLDDDDYFLHEYCFELLADKIGKNNEDILDFAFIWKGEGYKVPSRDECFVMAWCRAWRRSFIGDNRFDDAPYGSDKHFFQKMIQNNPDVTVTYWNSPMYYYNYLREGSLSWMEKKHSLLDIIITHYNEPWELGKPFFDMLEHQKCIDFSDVSITLVQDGPEYALPWKDLLAGYSFKVKILTIPHTGTAAARNVGISKTEADWITFFNFDDAFADRCSLSIILRNLPTDEVNIIWGKVVQENKWYTGITYLNRIDGVNFSDTDGKLYRRQFIVDNNLSFDTRSEYYYDSIFNSIAVSVCEQWKIVQMTSDFYPFMKTFRPDSFRHTLPAFDALRDGVFYRDKLIADEMYRRKNMFGYRKTVAKIIAYGYYQICTPDQINQPHPLPAGFIEYYHAHKDEFESIRSSSDMDVIKMEVESEVFNLIQSYYNEHKIEYYFINDNVPFDDWLNSIDLESQAKQNLPVPVQLPVHKTTIPTRTDHSQRVVVYCGTYDVYLNMIASVKSLLCNTPVDKVYFLCEDDNFPYELPDIIETINVKNQTYFPSDGPNFDNAWTYMCMIRAAFPELFPQYDKILSLDIDIVINDNVSDLWNYDISDYYLAGVAEKQRQKSSADPLYINFGVTLMNLDKLRRDNMQDRIISALNHKKFGCPEQDAYNQFCAGHILELPAEFNFTTYSHITGEAIRERIIHYAGQKFWRHYSLVKQYADLEWNEVMQKQNDLKAGEQNA